MSRKGRLFRWPSSTIQTWPSWVSTNNRPLPSRASTRPSGEPGISVTVSSLIVAAPGSNADVVLVGVVVASVDGLVVALADRAGVDGVAVPDGAGLHPRARTTDRSP